MHDKVPYIKTVIVACSIFIASFFLTQAMMAYIETQGYFSLNFAPLSKIGILILLSAYTVALSSPAWNEWSQLLVVSLPFSLGIFLNLLALEPANALVMAVAIFIILSFFVEKSVRLEKTMAKSIPSVFLRSSIRGLFLCISLLAAGIVILSPGNEAEQLTENVGEVANNQISQYINKKLLSENPEAGMLLQYTNVEQNLNEEISNQVENAIEPYRNLIHILMAVLVFVTLQGFSTIIYIIFNITIGLIFFIAKKTKFFRKETELIEKEILKF